MRTVFLGTCLALLVAVSPARAEDQEKEQKSTSFIAVGPTYAGNLGGAHAADSFGAVLEGGKNIPIAERVDIGLRLAWGLTAWDRVERWGKAGYDTGRWTTNAYRDVYDWTRKHSGDPNTQGLRLVGGFFAFMVLWMGYAVAGLIYAATVVAPTTYLEGDLTAGYHFGDRKLDPYLKGGVGLLAFIHPDVGVLVGGVGPTAGFGFRTGDLRLGGEVTVSPPYLHGEARGGHTSILIGALTIGIEN